MAKYDFTQTAGYRPFLRLEGMAGPAEPKPGKALELESPYLSAIGGREGMIAEHQVERGVGVKEAKENAARIEAKLEAKPQPWMRDDPGYDPGQRKHHDHAPGNTHHPKPGGMG